MRRILKVLKMDTKNSIEKLNNSNYFTWKLKMKLFLIKEDLWDVIKDERPTLLNDSRASVREQNRWIKRDQKALASARRFPIGVHARKGNSTGLLVGATRST